MTIVQIPGTLWLPSYPNQISAGASLLNVALDAADEGIAAVLRVPKTGNVAKVLWATGPVSTGATIKIRGETIDETVSPSIPSGTLYHANFTGTTVIGNADDSIAILTTLTAPVAVSVGDKIAVVIKQPSSSFGNMNVPSFGDANYGFPYALGNTGVSPAVSWAASAGAAMIGLEYDDGSYAWIAGCYPFIVITGTVFNNTSTPDEIGLRFKVPWPCRLSHCWVYVDADGDFNINLYGADGATKIGGTPLATDKDTRRTTAGDIQFRRFTSPPTLLANTWYRITVEPTSATNLSMYDFTVNTAAVMDAFEGGQSLHLTSAKNPAAEGDWTNTLTRRPFMGIGIDGFDDGVSVGGQGISQGLHSIESGVCA